MSRCKQGGRNAFTELVASFERPVFAVAFRMLGNVADAADVAQSVFLKVFEHIDDYDQQRRAFSWIYRIAVNESLDRMRWRKRNGMEQEGAHGPDGGESILDRQASDEDGPDGLLEASQRHDSVQAALMELQRDYRTVIVLRHFSGCSYGEIAEILHVPEKTVKSRLHTARQLLRSRLCERGVETA